MERAVNLVSEHSSLSLVLSCMTLDRALKLPEPQSVPSFLKRDYYDN